MNVFDIVGPIMVGPSSSHTAGANRIGRYAREILNEEPKKVTVQLSGSFKETYKGHGTDKAIVAGLLGYKEDDERIRNSIEIAKDEDRDFDILEKDIEDAHVNTARIMMKRSDGSQVTVQGASIGGGNIMITRINDVDVAIRGIYDTLIVGHKDVPGMIYKITEILYDDKVNINSLSLHRSEKAGDAVVIIEVDDKLEDNIKQELLSIENILNVTVLHAL